MIKEPLAYRVRPTKLEDILGQEHIIGKNKLINNMLESKTLFSMIFFGSSGTGKTTLALLIASLFNIKYKVLNAVTCSKKDIESVLFEAKLENDNYLLIIDEIHRLNKNIQDILLPSIESGRIILIGATTANPYHSINPAIRSRCQLIEIKPLKDENIIEAINRALKIENGLNNEYEVSKDAIELLAKYSNGDLRFALNKLEIACISSTNKKVDVNNIKEIMTKSYVTIDKNEDGHYDAISALQKSIRGSDVDAALYYLARLIAADDLDSIERRLLITAYEDVGLANPQAVDRTYNAIQTARLTGFPEGAIPLGFAVCDLALSPKSKSACLAIEKAIDLVNEKDFKVPDYLRMTPVGLSDDEKYNYERLDLVEKIQYLPALIKDMKFYKPSDETGPYEQSLKKNYDRLSKIKRTSNLKELYKNH